MYKKHLREKKLLFAYLRFVFLYFSAFSKTKEFKRSQETSFYVIQTI